MITFAPAETREDLLGILDLQRANLATNLSPEEIAAQGFVTVVHTLHDLSELNNAERHIVAKDADCIIGYLLAMTQSAKSAIPVLIPMFEAFDVVQFKNKAIKEYTYIVVGQVCVDKQFRGQGIIDKCYAAYKAHFAKKYDFAITEIASINLRSRNAHKRIGFKEIQAYTAGNIEWIIVIWDWHNTDQQALHTELQ